MSAQNDIKQGLHAVVPASRDDVARACVKAAETLGSRAEASAGTDKVTVKIYPGLVRKVSTVSPTVGVTLRPHTNGGIEVSARIEHYRTAQQRFMFIPVSPKTLVGKGSYENYLRALRLELIALGKGESQVELTSSPA